VAHHTDIQALQLYESVGRSVVALTVCVSVIAAAIAVALMSPFCTCSAAAVRARYSVNLAASSEVKLAQVASAP
jgi:uncharacterized membrane protein